MPAQVEEDIRKAGGEATGGDVTGGKGQNRILVACWVMAVVAGSFSLAMAVLMTS